MHRAHELPDVGEERYKKGGVIYFKEGEITHSESDNTEGEEAFYEILSWELGSFLCDEVMTETQTIHENWDFLLMESMRRLDRLWGP